LIKSQNTYSAIVFCGTKRTVDKIARNLRSQKIESMPIHGDLTQSKRTQAVNALKSGRIDVLVATDVAARGLDIDNITHIYNYDVPRTAEEYVHRIGRTARAGKSGEAITLVSERDYKQFNEILRDRSLNINQVTVPDYEKLVLKRDFGHESRGDYQDRSNYSQQGYGQRSSFHGQSRGHHSQGGYSQRDSFRPSRPRQDYGGSNYSKPYSDNSSDSSAEFYSNKHAYSHPRPMNSFHKPRPSYGGHSHTHSQPSSNSSRADSYPTQSGKERTPRTYEPYKRNDSYSKAPSHSGSYQRNDSHSRGPRESTSYSKSDSHASTHSTHKSPHHFGKKKSNFSRKRF
jgi:ATP-dependent RNA helicase DeaD